MFKAPLVEDIVSVLGEADEMTSERQPLEPSSARNQEDTDLSTHNDQEQLKALMGQLQQMISQVERLQVPQSPVQKAA
ncbi:MAG: hypothetical protein F6K35_43440 [Okeania sp. SIO2H7]|nr:hypothetical protein [Okeania sp. SIO2H7]